MQCIYTEIFIILGHFSIYDPEHVDLNIIVSSQYINAWTPHNINVQV